MISQTLAQKILAIAISGGADFAELYISNEIESVIQQTGGRIENASDNFIRGAGIRTFFGTKTVFATTNDLTENGLVQCAKNVASATENLKYTDKIILSPFLVENKHICLQNPCDADAKIRADLLREAAQSAKDYHEKILQTRGFFLASDRQFQVCNTEGLFTSDRMIRTRLSLVAIANDGKENQVGSCSPGASQGLEFWEIHKPKDIGKEAARQAIVNLNAEYCPSGKMTVAIENGFGGVIFHEACGHSLEATSVAIGSSQMAGKLGQQIANVKVTAIDDGTIQNAWGSNNIDDEGNKTQRNILIENGILKNYLVDRLGSRRMGLPQNGCSRRQNYCYEPTSRMSNTFIDNGPDKNEDIIASMENGLYCAKMGGGSVNPLNGAFNFSVSEGYLVKNGKITTPVRGASLIGTGSEILQNIDMVGQNLDRGQGMCGSCSGSIPTDVGQPLIRVSSITVGGR